MACCKVGREHRPISQMKKPASDSPESGSQRVGLDPVFGLLVQDSRCLDMDPKLQGSGAWGEVGLSSTKSV